MKTTDCLNAVLLLLALSALTFTTACSRNPEKPERSSQGDNRAEQPNFSQISSEPSETGQVLALAEAAYAAKDWETSEKHYVSITRAIPKEATPWFRLGNIYARTDRPDFAVRAYKEALLRDPQMSKAWYNMGLVQLRQSANSFLQMRTYTADDSEAQIRADTMYRATIGLIKDGPSREARSFPYTGGGTVTSPTVNELPSVSAPAIVIDSSERNTGAAPASEENKNDKTTPDTEEAQSTESTEALNQGEPLEEEETSTDESVERMQNVEDDIESLIEQVEPIE